MWLNIRNIHLSKWRKFLFWKFDFWQIFFLFRFFFFNLLVFFGFFSSFLFFICSSSFLYSSTRLWYWHYSLWHPIRFISILELFHESACIFFNLRRQIKSFLGTKNIGNNWTIRLEKWIKDLPWITQVYKKAFPVLLISEINLRCVGWILFFCCYLSDVRVHPPKDRHKLVFKLFFWQLTGVQKTIHEESLVGVGFLLKIK